MTFCESCTQSVRLNALQEAVGHGHPELQITLPQMKTQFRRSCKFLPFFVEYLFLFPLIPKVKKSTEKCGNYSEKYSATFLWPTRCSFLNFQCSG